MNGWNRAQGDGASARITDIEFDAMLDRHEQFVARRQ